MRTRRSSIFLLPDVVQNAIVGSDTSLLSGKVEALTAVTVNVAVNRLIAVNASAARVVEERKEGWGVTAGRVRCSHGGVRVVLDCVAARQSRDFVGSSTR
jgi:hypothetical protein